MSVKAPYNFVPLADKIFYPDWAEQVSQDVPFSDELSGVINLKITAKTVIFVRNGSKKEDKDNRFSHRTRGGEKEYFIPGTSIKGAIRSVLEIMSFGKINTLNKEVTKNIQGTKVNYGNPYQSVERYYKDIDNSQYNEDKADLAETIFGYVRQNKSVKGRVSFSCAIAENQPTISNRHVFTLGAPHSSYLPIYVVQNDTNDLYKDYNNGTISGWKRYLLQPIYGNNTTSDGTGKTETIMYPLAEGTCFTSKVYYHNLRPIELQALISAITFHNNRDCYHQLGQAKSYGLGRVSIEVINKEDFNFTFSDYESEMNLLENNWLHSPQVESLLLMASYVLKADQEEVKYMTFYEYNDILNDKEESLLPFKDMINEHKLQRESDKAINNTIFLQRGCIKGQTDLTIYGEDTRNNKIYCTLNSQKRKKYKGSEPLHSWEFTEGSITPPSKIDFSFYITEVKDNGDIVIKVVEDNP